MIDLDTFRDCKGVGRNVLEWRIGQLCRELEETRQALAGLVGETKERAPLTIPDDSQD